MASSGSKKKMYAVMQAFFYRKKETNTPTHRLLYSTSTSIFKHAIFVPNNNKIYNRDSVKRCTNAGKSLKCT